MISIIQNNLAGIRDLCLRHNVLRLYVFGSAVRDCFKPGESDVDFIVEFREMEPGKYIEAYFGLTEGLGDILGTEIDLVLLKAVKNPYFLESINRSKRKIYEES